MSAPREALSFEVLAEPNRRAILDSLRRGERPVGDLVSSLDLSQPAVSKHLRILREAGMVEVRVDAQRRLYRLRAAGLKGLDNWIRPYRKMWQAGLDALGRHLDTMSEE
jgi:DNA-binding transcriptional ArsR family regulator